MEIQTPEFGCGLDPVLRTHAAKVTGVLNGVDMQEWDPATDPRLARHYSLEKPTGKAGCRKALLKECGWPADAPEMLVGMISRLAAQKGFDVVREAWGELAELPVRLVLLGSGDRALEDWFRTTAAEYPGKLSARIGFDEAFSHRIEAGTDVFLMPSRYEPCGLNQMYSQRYGTLPVVHATGGLRDSVEDWLQPEVPGTGFHFSPCEPGALVAALKRALELHGQPRLWKKAVQRAMARDFSWEHAAAEYERVYARALV
jgi:starch synthase